MLIVVSGGSGSGKSAFAEDLIVTHGAESRTYIATMQLWDAECEARAEKHRAMRAGKGFATIECPVDLEGVTPEKTVLLEDVSNLLANEYFGGDGATAQERVYRGIVHLATQCQFVVVVTNELFSDGIAYEPETQHYLNTLASLNCQIATLADAVYEVVAGIPICHKGKGLMLP